jgi:hypothetical protein
VWRLFESHPKPGRGVSRARVKAFTDARERRARGDREAIPVQITPFATWEAFSAHPPDGLPSSMRANIFT